MGKLSGVNWIYIERNNFGGPLPSEIGIMPNLQEISLYGNQFTGKSWYHPYQKRFQTMTGNFVSHIGTNTSLFFIQDPYQQNLVYSLQLFKVFFYMRITSRGR